MMAVDENALLLGEVYAELLGVKSSPGYNFQMTQKHLFYRYIKQMQQKVNRTG